MRELLPYFALLIAVISCGISAWTAVRAARWRNGEAHSALVGRVGSLERNGELRDQRIKTLEEDIAALPTKADFTRLEGEIKTTCAIADRTERAVLRLENHILAGDK